MSYVDKNGNAIKAGMLVKDSEGAVEVVFAGEDGKLGVNASNENHIAFTRFDREIYPLEAFSSDEFEIVSWEESSNGENKFGNYKKQLGKNTDKYFASKPIEKILSKFGISEVGYVDSEHYEILYSGVRDGESVRIIWKHLTGDICVKSFAKQP